jgi:hypothetical protein
MMSWFSYPPILLSHVQSISLQHLCALMPEFLHYGMTIVQHANNGEKEVTIFLNLFFLFLSHSLPSLFHLHEVAIHPPTYLISSNSYWYYSNLLFREHKEPILTSDFLLKLWGRSSLSVSISNYFKFSSCMC